jgi:hypothetical protein
MQRQTQLANDLWPLLLPRIQAMITGAASGSGSGSGGSGAVSLAAHDLGGSLHRGTLRSDQAPQFLLLDGTRPLAGSLAVDTGVTIDGVDISAHAADINAHHAKLHGITDAANHSATGALQYQIVGIPTAGTLGYLTPKSSPAANEVVKTDSGSGVTLVDLTVTSDLFMSGYLDFGTNTMYEDASYLQVTGSKPVRFGQNIGNANWTVYNAGGASFGGSVDIVGSGDLYVAGSLGGAGGVLKTAGNRVGIACVPDSQFALDVAGPARAQYFIGPHAIQLKDATMILHFDGAAPYRSNYNGVILGHKGQPATTVGGIVHRPGKFGKAVQITRGGNNAVTHPSFELGTVGVTPDGWSFSGAGSFVKSADVAYYGDYSAKLTVAAQWAYPTHTLSGGINLNSAQTVSAWVWVESYTSGTLTLSVQRTDTFAEVMQVNVDTSAGKRKQWQRVSATWPGSGGGTVAARVKLQTSNPATMTVYVDAVQVEPYVYCSPYIDGSVNRTGDTAHAWTGTAHASGSTRTAAELYYAIGNVDPREGTVSAWVYVDGFFNNNRLFHFRNDDGSFDYYLSSVGGAIFRYNSVSIGGGTLAARTWHHVAITWSLESGYAYAYLDGVQTGAAAITGPTLTDATLMSIGHKWGTSQLNGMIDDFAILSTAASATQVRAIYESNAPVFAESSTVSWVATPSGLVWADERGLWMRDTSGNPVLGVYGGEAATYNWAGFDMSAGDLVLGRNAVGSSAIWWDKDNGKFGFYGAGSGTPQVEIATDGKLTAGAGKIKLDSAGFHAFNASAVATIDIDSNGIYLGDGGGRTTIGTWTSGNRVRAYNVGELYEATPETYLDDSSVSRTLYPLVLRAIRQGNDAALVEISAVNTSNVGAFVRVGEGFRLKDYYGSPYSTNRVVHASATDIILEATNLQLRSLTTSAAAVGAYSGKIRINIAGTNYYIPYYAS